ncbi:MAG: helix-turn-helix transcriptional regulator [Desulfovibrionaceae bacterium]|nr:helix-turn-helix transcriptional regulator [Desulfovibrionaceae bacterium]
MLIPRKDSLVHSALEIIRRAVSGHPYRNQAELARATGVSEANISRWLNGNVTPTLGKLEPVLLALGAYLEVLLDRKPSVPKKRIARRRRIKTLSAGPAMQPHL